MTCPERKSKTKVDCIWRFCTLKVSRTCDAECENPEGYYQESGSAQDACPAVLHTHHLAFHQNIVAKQRQ